MGPEFEILSSQRGVGCGFDRYRMGVDDQGRVFWGKDHGGMCVVLKLGLVEILDFLVFFPFSFRIGKKAQSFWGQEEGKEPR